MSANVIADEDRQGFKHQHTSLLMGVPRLQINKFIFSSFHSWLVTRESFFLFIFVEWYFNTKNLCGDFVNI